MSSSKLEEAVAEALEKAIKIVREKTSPETHWNAIIVAAAELAPILIEIDLDDE